MVDLDNRYVDPALDAKIDTIREKCELICSYMLNYQCSIRQCAINTCIPKSTVHTYIHTYIQNYYDEEYGQLRRLLKWNKQNRSMPRQYWPRERPW